MATCSPKCRSKLRSPFYIAGISLLTAIILVTAAVNVFVNLSRPGYSRMIGEFLNCKISLGRIYFVPFNVFIVTDVQSEERFDSRPLCAADRIILRLDIPSLLREKRFVPLFLGIKKGLWTAEKNLFANRGGLSGMFSGNRAIPPLKAVLEDTELVIRQESGGSVSFRGELQMQTTAAGNISLSGMIRKDSGLSSENAGATFRIRALQNKTGYQFQNIEIKNSAVYAKLWGEARENEVYLNGMVSGNSRLWNFHSRSPVWSRAREKIKSLCFWNRDSSPSIVGGEPCGLQIFDLECGLRFLPEKIDLCYARYTLNDVPFLVKGSFLFAGQPELKLDCSSYPGQAGPARRNNSEAFDMKINGIIAKDGFSGEISSKSVRRTHKGYLPQTIKAVLKDLRFVCSQNETADILCERSSIGYSSAKEDYAVEITDICLTFNAGRSSTSLKLHSRLYGGSLEGEGTVDMAAFPASYYLKISARDIKPELIDVFSPYAAFSSGVARGEVVARNTPQFELSGRVEIEEGVLHDSEFFSWLAGFCRISSLASVPFSRLSAHFMVTPDSSSIDEIKLSADCLGLDGYFHLYQSGLVSGKASLGFSRDLLASSPKFKSLVRLLGDGVSAARFEFKLSGLCEAMNFKWMSTDFKEKLQDLLPRGMEKSIEKKIEAVVLAISAQ